MNTKKHHYVSQFLLNYWTCEGSKNKKINIFDISRSDVRYNQAVREVFFQNYFYDRRLEKILAEMIEGPASTIVKKIVSGNFNIIREDLLILNKFIYSLFCRTPANCKRVDERGNVLFKPITQEALSLGGFDPAEASAGKFNFNDDDSPTENTIEGLIMANILEDLEYHVIKNETSSDFYISVRIQV